MSRRSDGVNLVDEKLEAIQKFLLNSLITVILNLNISISSALGPSNNT